MNNEVVCNLLKNTKDINQQNVSDLPPITPKGGTYFVYRYKDVKCKNDYKADAYMWRNRGNYVYYPSKKDKQMRRTRYDIVNTSEEGYSRGFSRYVFELLEDRPLPAFALIQYVGDENLFTGRPHGNAKHSVKRFKPTAASVRINVKTKAEHVTAKNVYIEDTLRNDVNAEYQGVLNVRNLAQAKKQRQRVLDERKMGIDPLLNIHLLHKYIPNFIRKLDTLDDFMCITAMDSVIEMVNIILQDTKAKLVFSYDTTFNCGDYYLSVLVFRHPYIKGNPCIPVAFMMHDRKIQAVHSAFMEKLTHLMPQLNGRRSVIIMDREKSMANAVRQYLPAANIIFCWNHLLKDIEEWVKRHNKSKDRTLDEHYYKREVRSLLHCHNVKNYSESADNATKRWDMAFLQYFTSFIEKDILNNCGRWVIAQYGLYDASSGITNNTSEAYNHVIKSFLRHREVTPDIMVIHAYTLQSSCLKEMQRWLAGCGELNAVQGNEEKLRLSIDPTVKILDTTQAVENVRAEVESHLEERKIRHHVLSETGSQESIMDHSYASTDISNLPSPSIPHMLALHTVQEKRVWYVPEAEAYLVKGECGTYAVTLTPKELCRCNGPKKCYHILAAQMKSHTYRQSVEKQSTPNITRLNKSMRPSKQKSGRKRPRPCDKEAQDDVSETGTQSQETVSTTKRRKLLSLAKQRKTASEDAGGSKSQAIIISQTPSTVVDNKERASAPWISELFLNNKERDLIRSENGWLTDSSMEAANILLKRQFPDVNGLSSTHLIPTWMHSVGGFDYGIKDEEIATARMTKATPGEIHIQLHNNLRDHWVCSTQDRDGSVYLYDSLSESNNGFLGLNLEMQLAHIYGVPNSVLPIIIPYTDQQLNDCDCGIFAISNATYLCIAAKEGRSPQHCRNVYEKKKMREHLLACFYSRCLTMFPTGCSPAVSKMAQTVHISLGCHACSLPSAYNTLESCRSPGCTRVFHQLCGSRTDGSKAGWFCNVCKSV